MPKNLLVDWTSQDYATLEQGVVLANHDLPATGLFTDDALAYLLDHHPDEALTVSTMGSDATRFEWIEGDRNGATGSDMVRLLKEGRLWLNLRNVMQHHPAIREAVNSIYDTLEANARHFQAEDRSANLLVSSSTAMVHYHVDMPVNMLWHIRGQKRVWVYPHFDYRFAAQDVIEKVCAGEFSEDVPFSPNFDNYATVFDVEPGQLLTWPQLTPHRVQNLDGLCVSLSTEHKNATARRRINVHQANYWLRNKFGWGYGQSNVDGVMAHMKQTLARGERVVRKFCGSKDERFTYPKRFAIDLDVSDGIRMFESNPQMVAPHEPELVG